MGLARKEALTDKRLLSRVSRQDTRHRRRSIERIAQLAAVILVAHDTRGGGSVVLPSRYDK